MTDMLSVAVSTCLRLHPRKTFCLQYYPSIKLVRPGLPAKSWLPTSYRALSNTSMQLCGRTNGLLQSTRSYNPSLPQRQTHALLCQRCCSLRGRKTGICIVTAIKEQHCTTEGHIKQRNSKSLLSGVPLLTATTWLLSCLPAASITCQQQAAACYNGSIAAPLQDSSLGSLFTAFVVLILLTLAVQPPKVKGPSRTIHIPGKWLNRLLQVLTGSHHLGVNSNPSSRQLFSPKTHGSSGHFDGTQSDEGILQSTDALGQGLTGTSRASVRSYIDMTSGQSREPGVVALRNQALATAATYSVCVAVKDCQPRVRKLLSDLTNDERDVTHQTTQPQTLMKPATVSISTDDNSGFSSFQEAALKQLVVHRLQTIAESGVQGAVDLSDSELNILQQQVMQAVAEQAAVEQIEALLDVVGDLHGDGAQPPGGATGSAWRNSSISNDTRQQQARNQDIRGGGAH